MADFCTVGDIEDFLQLTIAAGAQTDAAEAAIDEAMAAIRNYCHQTISLVEDDEHTFDVSARCQKLFLPELPVTEISKVEEEDSTGTMAELTVTDDYKLARNGVVHRVDYFWTAGVQTVTVTYSHGHATIPDDVKKVCVRAAARAFQAGLRAAESDGISGVAGMTLGDYSVTYGSEQSGGVSGGSMLGASAAPMLLPSEKRMLDKYRFVGLASERGY